MTDSRHNKAVVIQDAIRQVLLHDWDPIGVGNNPNLADEYDSYIAPVYRILINSRSEDELIDVLSWPVSATSGSSAEPRGQLQPIARKLLTLDVKL